MRISSTNVNCIAIILTAYASLSLSFTSSYWIALMAFHCLIGIAFMRAKMSAWGALFWSLVSTTFYSLHFDNLSGVDELYFFTALLDADPLEMITNEIERQKEDPGAWRSRTTFPLLLAILLSPFPIFELDPRSIFFLNTGIWLIAILLWSKAISNHIQCKRTIYFLTFFLIASPTYSFWLGNFGKDTISISLALISSSFLLQRNWLSGIIFLLLASLFRPYSIVLVFIYTAPFLFNLRNVLLSTTAAFALLIAAAGAPLTATTNWVISSVYFFMSPNPFAQSNWSLYNFDTWHFSPALMTLEGVFTVVILLITLALLLTPISKQHRSLVIKILLNVTIAAATITLVGIVGLESRGDDVQPGSLGDNFVRKKLIIWPLVGLLVGLTLSKIRLKNHEWSHINTKV